ncbi:MULTISPECIES: hypothetical protein [Bizionia]|uniref:Uncharacterized protein n=1 Tax=Bizionia algoritergicola TaxID=291187 RepID=A0A5D0QXK8_9FLAO|nr:MULTISPECIES: hypothetical protein [Bizionia]OBX23405.1 hypothetical protein BAA08_04960 [Bizionia sp. APA-3]TYB73401.1 hypothetical protein ES675_06995 [Bizionia algoritergicola]
MKQSIKTIILFFLCFFALFSTIYAQQSINYKAIIKDDIGNVIANDVVPVQFNILQGVAQTNVYSELHTPTTDANGIIIVSIGEGILVGGSPDFSTIDWTNDTNFLQVFVNIGDGLVDMGITEFNAVPYALSSGDKSWETEIDNVHVLSKNVGIGTDSPSELLEINDPNNATIKLTVPTVGSSSKLEFETGDETGAHTFYRIENRSDYLRFETDTDYIIPTTGYESLMNLGRMGLTLETGARVNEFSTDGTLADNSNNALPTEQAVKTYVDNSIASVAATAKTIVIPATAFISNGVNNTINYGFGGGFVNKPSGNSAIYAPVIIPGGSTITSVTFFFRDTNSAANVNLEATLISIYQTNSFSSFLFTVSTFGGLPDGITRVYATPFSTTGERQYYIRVQPTSNWSGTDLAVYSVKVIYTE